MEILSNGTKQYALNLSDQSPDEADVITQENSIDITAFLFPAIGAVLMLMFGGLLFSSGSSFSKTKTMSENRFKKKFEQQYGRRIIRFHNIPDKIAKEPSSVLQQENNDVVDAVRKEYNDLPQYQPISGLVGNIAGLHGQTCAVNIIRPEVTERGVSPIHSTGREYTSDYDNPSYKDKDSDAEHEDDVNKKKSLTITLQDKDIAIEDVYTQRNRAASSGIGTNSPDSYEIDSLEEFPTSENDSLDLAEAEIPGLQGRASLNDSAHRSVHAYDRGVYGGGRLSVLEIKRAPSSICLTGCSCPIHRTEGGRINTELKGARTSDMRLTWGDIALNLNGNLSLENESDVKSTVCDDMLRFATPSAEISGPLTTENMREMNQSPLQRMDLEKWLHDVEKSRKTGEVAYDQAIEFPDAKKEKHRRDYLTTQRKEFVPSRRKIRAPLQESLQLLKKLQLVEECDLASAQNPVHLGGRASCLDTVRAPSSLCLCGGHCRVHGQSEITSDRCIAPANVIEDDTETDKRTDIARGSHQPDSTRTERITKGGRQSTLNLLRASSGMCIHGPSCRIHCHKMGDAEFLMPESGIDSGRSLARSQKLEINSEPNELRGASEFGELQVSFTHNTSNNHGISDCAQEQSVSKTTEWGKNEFRGASSFGDSRSAKTQEINDLNTRGASSFAEQPPERLHSNHSHETSSIQSYLGEIKGASGFAPLDESIVGTSSVTLSFAVESDVESFSVEKSLMEKKRGTSVGTVVEKGGAPNRNCGSKVRTKAPVRPIEKHNHQTNTWKTEDKENIVEQDNNSLTSHDKGCKTETIARAEKPDIRDEEKQRYKRFDERILKVGKDTTMMCTLLSALRRDGKQKRKDTEASNYDIIHRIDEENLTNGREASVGSLKFSVLYKGADSVTPLLYVTVLGLEGVSNETVTKESTVYVKVCLSPKFTTWRRTRALNVSEALVFKDHFIISGVKPIDLEEAILRFVVVCVREEERVIGELDVPLEELKSRDKFKRTCALHAPHCPKNDKITRGSELE